VLCEAGILTTFTRAGGSVAEYAAGIAHATAQKWLKIDSSGTRITLLADGADNVQGKTARNSPRPTKWAFTKRVRVV
jgi:hypothetical protein